MTPFENSQKEKLKLLRCFNLNNSLGQNYAIFTHKKLEMGNGGIESSGACV